MFNNFVYQSVVMDTRPALFALLLVICVLSAGCTSLFPARSSKGPAELTGPSWRLVSYYGGNQTVVSVGPRINLTLKFGEDGNVSGFVDGCRSFSGRYTTLGETISVTNITGVDRNTCPWTPDTDEVKTTSITLLQKSPRFNINEGTLVFGYFDAQRFLLFQKN
jgi:heat shock protein HslJ